MARRDRVAELFDEALKRPEDRRPGYLESVCDGDAELRREVESLLAHHSPSFLDRPSHLSEAFRAHLERRHPDQIDDYEILEELGSGGMGVVYLAQQLKPIRRKVALKLIKWGMDTEKVVARFEAERQALAMMDHPNIAKVLAAGASDTGRPYFVMEHVQGVPITTHCDTERLDTRGRLELFLDVCDGIQHAHQKGIIHRDIKATNVLVSKHGHRSLPMVIDFGVAKATEHGLVQASIYTETEQLIGTPEYMSPEQAAMSADIDTRTDVYSLGILLYEMLVGALPFDPARFRAAGLDEMRRRIREVDPPTPSRRLVSLGGNSAVSAHRRRGDIPGLLRQLRGDLDWITMKALEKDRDRRYGSVSQLADDVRRFMRGEPVLAGPPGSLYRLRKFILRNKTVVTFGAAVIVLLTGFAVAMTVQAQRVKRERDAAREVLVSLEDLLSRHARQAAGNPAGAGELFASQIDNARRQLKTRPAVQARLLGTIADLCDQLEYHDQAAEARQAVLDLHRNSGEEPRLVADDLHALGSTLVQAARFEDAAPLLEESLRLRLAAVGDGHPDVAATQHQLGLTHWNLDEFAKAEGLFRRALEIRRTVLPVAPPALVESLQGLGRLLTAGADYPQAEGLLVEAVALARSVSPERPELIAGAMEDLANLMYETGRYTEAEFGLQEASMLIRRSMGPEHSRAARLLAATALVRAERLDFRTCLDVGLVGPTPRCPGPGGMAGRSLGMLTRQFGPDHPHVARTRLIAAKIESIRRRAIIADCRDTLDSYRRLFPEAHTRLAEPMTVLGRSLALWGRAEQAEAVLREALEIRRRQLPDSHWKTAETRSSLGLAMIIAARFEEAEPLLVESLRIIQAGRRPDHRSAREALEHLIILYTATGETEKATSHRQHLVSSLAGSPVTYADFSAVREAEVRIDYDDDGVMKIIEVDPSDLSRATRASLWVLGRAHNWPGYAFVPREDYFIRLNDDPSQEILFDVGHRFGYMSDVFQWVPFRIPLEWLRPTSNRFWISERPPKGAWTHNNLDVAIDRQTDHDHSWWCGSTSSPCENAAVDVAARQGELMIALELVVPGREETAVPSQRLDERLGSLSLWTGEVLERRGEHAAAERLLRGAVALLRHPSPEALRVRAESGLGGALTGLGRYEEAEPLLIRSFEFLVLKQPVASENSYSRTALERLVEFYEVVRRPDRVEHYRFLMRGGATDQGQSPPAGERGLPLLEVP